MSFYKHTDDGNFMPLSFIKHEDDGNTLTCQTKYDYVKGQKSLVLNKKQCHKPYKFDLEVKVLDYFNLKILFQMKTPIWLVEYVDK